jgi:hypothetical protein
MKIHTCQGFPFRHKVLWTFCDVTLTGHTMHYPDVLLRTEDILLLPVHEKTMSLGFGSRYEQENMEFQPPVVSTNNVCKEPVFFFIYNTSNYFHFLYDTLPYLIHYLALPKDTKLLMNPERAYPFILDCLQLLGIEKNRIVYAKPNTVYSTVYVGNSLTHDGLSNKPPHPDVFHLFASMRTAACATLTETPKKIYISRRSWIHGDLSNIGTNYTTRRKMICEDELVTRLIEKGFTEVFCETMSMTEKIQMFAQATHVVGAIGGGMCNLVFASPECRVLSINSPEFDTINRRFLFTMEHTTLTQFRNTWTTNNLYRRVRVESRLGEVHDESEHQILAAFNTGVSWANDQDYTTQWVPIASIEYIDNGLNSPWCFHVNDCIELI